MIRTSEKKKAVHLISQARKLRRKWLYRKKIPDWKRRMTSKIDDLVSLKLTEQPKPKFCKMGEDGIMSVEGVEKPYSSKEFHKDYDTLLDIVNNGPVRTQSHERLNLLRKKFDMHKELNGQIEEEWNKSNGLDFYTINKVDTHVHLAAAFSAKRFTEFVKDKFENWGSDIVDKSKNITLSDIAKEINFDPSRLNVDSIDVTADETIFNRFDHFNAKYNPCGNSTLRKLFLKSDNSMNGRYFAELTDQVFRHLKHGRAGKTFTEYRFSVYISLR